MFWRILFVLVYRMRLAWSRGMGDIRFFVVFFISFFVLFMFYCVFIEFLLCVVS